MRQGIVDSNEKREGEKANQRSSEYQADLIPVVDLDRVFHSFSINEEDVVQAIYKA